jgi:glutamate-1-semialdehyde aminotransferase
MAVRLARLATGKKVAIVFTNSYHGWSDMTMVRLAGTKTLPVAPGIISDYTVQLNHDCLESLEFIKANAKEIAAVLIEPVQSRRVDLHPRVFLKALRKITEENNIVLIFDEVVTGFRMHPGGAQGLWKIRADLCTYGKAIGGGMPIGIVSGKAIFMDGIDGGMQPMKR